MTYILFHSSHFFKHFLQKNYFKITKQILSFLIFNNSSPPHKSKSNNLKYCPNSEFFSIEVIEITSNISSAEIHVDLGYFVLKF